MHLYEFQVKKKNWLNNKETILDNFSATYVVLKAPN